MKKKTGTKIHILTGQEEAQLIYTTHSEFIHDKKDDFMYVDVGGGSTEINLIINSNLVFSTSYNIGTIRVLSDTVDPEEWARLEDDMCDIAQKYPGVDILGSGGNINKLYRLVDNKDKKLQRMTVDALKDINDRISHLSLEERVKQYKLKYDRADVIVPASHVFLSIADILGSQYIYVPTIGLSDGIIDDMVNKKIRKRNEKISTNTDNAIDVETDHETVKTATEGK